MNDEEGGRLREAGVGNADAAGNRTRGDRPRLPVRRARDARAARRHRPVAAVVLAALLAAAGCGGESASSASSSTASDPDPTATSSEAPATSRSIEDRADGTRPGGPYRAVAVTDLTGDDSDGDVTSATRMWFNLDVDGFFMNTGCYQYLSGYTLEPDAADADASVLVLDNAPPATVPSWASCTVSEADLGRWAWYGQLLSSRPILTVDGDRLEVAGAVGSLSMTAIEGDEIFPTTTTVTCRPPSCQPTTTADPPPGSGEPVPASVSELAGRRFRFVIVRFLDAPTIAVIPAGIAFVEVGTDGTITGHDGCTPFSGRITSNGESNVLTVDSIERGASKCNPEATAARGQIVDLLATGAPLAWDGEQLLVGGGTRAVVLAPSS